MVTYPSDWNDVTVGDLVKTYGGLSGKRKEDFENGRRPFITYMDVYSHSVIRQPSGMVRVDESEYQNFVSPGDLLFTKSSETPDEVGKVATYSGMGQPFLNSFCFGGTPRQKFDANFLVQFLSHGAPRQAITLLAQGSTRYNLAPGRLLTLKIAIPTIREQRAIAEVLSGFDEHLANLDELIAKKRAVRDGVLDELLTGKQRLFGFNEGWSSLALEEVATIYDGVHQTPDYEASGIRFVSVEDVFDLYGSAKFISQTSYLRDFKVHPSKGDVLMTRIGDIGTPAYISDEEPLAYYVSLALLKPIRINGLFLYYYIQSKSFQRELFDRSLLHATPKKINKGEIGFCLVTMPRNLEEQRAIASVLSSIDEEIRLLVEERVKVELLKLGAMDDLLTGRVRLPLEEEAA
ncbi:restriction endonuclease subunit S [Varibaculum cambriense]|uniref:restriction endonuclease subunit S n=1 Tax=Varibaculum cambriense TaxID=184870 RepID=UPI002553E1D0|nr:restriction endonuclease subunit S [Varibaculum cambriense]MDK8274347.1 restriction endonuclease subunit S [Varibaculum cambriense]